jgi:hypothetical protein
MNVDATTGPLAAAAVVEGSENVSLLTAKREAFDVQARHVQQADRYRQGQKVAEGTDGQVIAGLLKWGTRSAWPESQSGTDNAFTPIIADSKRAQGGAQEETEGNKGSRPTARTNPKPKAARVQEDADAVKQNNGRQLSMDFANSDPSSTGSTAKRRSKTSPQPKG